MERPGKGDSSRAMGDGAERNPYFRYINRNKKSVTLDYKGPRRPRGVPPARRGVDVLVENYRATVMERAGLGYAALAGREPAAGLRPAHRLRRRRPVPRQGRLRPDRPGHGRHHDVTGEPDGPPTSVGQPICDLGTGMWGVQGILAALYERQRTGRGQKVECSLLETAIGFSRVDQRGLAGRRPGAHAPGLPPPPERAVPALRHRGRLHDDRRRRRRTSGSAAPARSAGPSGSRTRASGRKPTACGTGRRSSGRWSTCS